MSRYGENFLMDNMPIILVGVTILTVVILMLTGVISFPKADTRLYFDDYINTNPNVTNNIQDLNPLNRIRHDDGSALDSQMSRPDGNNKVYTQRGPRRRPSYPNINIPENPITDSGKIIPPLPNSTREMRAQPMIPEIPRLSSNYTNQKFGEYSVNNANKYMGGRVNTTSAGPFTPHEMRKSSRKSPY
jgi:hypothetical protein